MRRRDFVTLLGGAIAWPLAAHAQQTGPVRRIGVLIGFAETDPAVQSWLATFRGALTKLGWTEGSNLRIELRWAGYDPDRMKTFAKELVDLRPDAIFSVTTPVTGALIRETQAIPIVIANVADPIASGFVTSLGRPGGNVTGFALFEAGMGGKWLELLKDIAPGVTRVAVIRDAANPAGIGQFGVIQAVAPSFGVEVSPVDVRDTDDFTFLLPIFIGGEVRPADPTRADNGHFDFRH